MNQETVSSFDLFQTSDKSCSNIQDSIETFPIKGNIQARTLLKSLALSSGQSRTLLLIGHKGVGKFSAGLEFAQEILKENPLDSTDFFCFRNDSFALKTEYFMKYMPNTMLSWKWLSLLQHRISSIQILGESLSLPAGVKLSAIKEQIDESIVAHSFPQENKFLSSLIELAKVLDKKQGIPVDIIRESLKFHSVQTQKGRISILAGFDKADETTQNAALKLLEEPNPNHWLIITAEEERFIIPTIISRSLKIYFKDPLPSDLDMLYRESKDEFTTASSLMEEQVYHISHLKLELIKEFFEHVIPNIEFGISHFQFTEKLEKQKQSILFFEELLLCFRDALIIRHMRLRNLEHIPLLKDEYRNFSEKFSYCSTVELEALVDELSKLIPQIHRSVIKTNALVLPFVLNIGRILRKVK